MSAPVPSIRIPGVIRKSGESQLQMISSQIGPCQIGSSLSSNLTLQSTNDVTSNPNDRITIQSLKKQNNYYSVWLNFRHINISPCEINQINYIKQYYKQKQKIGVNYRYRRKDQLKFSTYNFI